jgi:fructose-bisphosphate aldolase class II
MRKAMAEKPDEFDPRAFLKAATAAARDICKARFEAFGCAGQGSRIGVRPLAKAA